MSNIAIIPARAGSKRIKNKNIIDFFGKPIIYYAIESARKSKIFDHIHVSTDSKRIKSIVNDLGLNIDFLRPKNLADDHTGTIPVLEWVLNKYKDSGKKFETVFNILPASPLLKSSDLIEAYKIYLKFKKKHPLHVITKFPVPIEWAYVRSSEGLLTPINPGAYKKRSQDFKETYYESGPFSIFNNIHLLAKEKVTDQSFVSYIMPRDRAIDIDDNEDLIMAKKLYLISNKKI